MDTVYTKREDAGKALLGLLGMAMNRTEPVSIGQYKGFDLQIAYFAMDKMYLAYLVGSGINPVQLGAGCGRQYGTLGQLPAQPAAERDRP